MEQASTVRPAAMPGHVAAEQVEWNIRALPLLLSIITIALGLVYLAVIPPWAGPDEPRHFEYVRLLQEKGRLVSWADADPVIMTEIIAAMDSVNYWKWGVSAWKKTAPGALPKSFEEIWPDSAHQLHQPPLSYLLYLVPLKLTSGGTIRTQLYAMRLLSILLDVLVVLAAYVAGREVFRDDPTMAVAVPVFVMLLPQHLFLHSTVMNDHLVEVALAWMLAVLARTFRLGLSLPRGLALLALLAIGLAAKRNALYGVGILAVAFVVYAFLHWGGGRLTSTQKSIRLAATVIGLGLAATGLFWGWNWISTNKPDLADYIVRLWLFLPTAQFPFQLDQRVIEPAALPLYGSYLKYVFVSMWGHFGWMNVTLGVQAYWGFAAVSFASLLGLGLYLVRDFRREPVARRATLIVFAASVLIALFLIIAIQVRYWDLGWGGDPQGRYLFPVLIPLAALFLLGLRAYFPRARYILWFGLMTGAMVLYNILALTVFIIPFYRA